MSMNSNGQPTGGSFEEAAVAFDRLLSPEETEDEQKAPQGEGEPPPAEEDDESQEPESDEDDSDEDDSEEGESDDDEDDEDEEREATYTVKIDGQEVEVTESELRNGYQRMADYTRKTQELAAGRKAVEAEFQQTREVRTALEQQLAQLGQVMQQFAPAEPNWDQLRATDPIEFAAQWADHQRRQAAMQHVQQQQRFLQQQREADEAQTRQQELQQARVWLTQQIPEWADAKVAQSERAAMKEMGKKYGYSEEELSQVADPRAVVLLRKAMMYDQLQQMKANITPSKKPKAPALKAGPTQSPPSAKKLGTSVRAKQRLAKTGNLSDAANYFATLL